MRWLKRAAYLLIAIVILAGAAIYLLPTERIAKLASDQFESATGRSLGLAGDIRPMVFPSPGVALGAVEIANAPWSESGPMISADGLQVSVRLASLLRGNIEISDATLISPRILLEISQDGQANWDIGEPSESAGGSAQADPQMLSIGSLAVTDADITYRDLSSGTETQLRGLFIDAAMTGPEGPLTLSAKGALGGAPLTIALTAQDASGLIAGVPTDFQLQARVDDASVAFDGTVAWADSVELAGPLSVLAPDTGKLLAALGQAGVSLPEGLGQSIELAGDLTGDGGNFSLANASLTLDQNELAGDLSLTLSGPRPFVVADLRTDALDLSVLGGEDGSANAGPEGWSKAPIDLSGLNAVDGDFTLIAASIISPTTTLGRTRLIARLRDGVMTVDIAEAAAYGGGLGGQLVASGQNGMSLSGNIDAKSVALQHFLKDLMGFDRISGAGDVALNFSGSGGSIHGYMNSLGGRGTIAFGRGELLGFDLIGMLRNLDASYQGAGGSTIFDSITASFDVTNGVVNNVDLNFLAPLADAVGEGTVGLGARTLNYRVTPQLFKGEEGNPSVAVPVLITGSWANPKFRPDLESLLNLGTGDAIEAIKDSVQDAVEDVKEGAEGKVRDAIEGEITKGLKGLLGGGN